MGAGADGFEDGVDACGIEVSEGGQEGGVEEDVVCAGFFYFGGLGSTERGGDDGVGVFFREGDRAETYGAGAAAYEDGDVGFELSGSEERAPSYSHAYGWWM